MFSNLAVKRRIEFAGNRLLKVPVIEKTKYEIYLQKKPIANTREDVRN